ncbi:hypothetical protein GWI33_013887 [Rhynchophorus ferrugineus]|uniref:Uncharacterized protein n=1 Tax=Rhynchophorus ferrugineus TaxID=354439 RepID=A0A834M679_RHYFE|nr:hypothetical protein GWI33_013887 [Rhynchophorus ferrugineus]
MEYCLIVFALEIRVPEDQFFCHRDEEGISDLISSDRSSKRSHGRVSETERVEIELCLKGTSDYFKFRLCEVAMIIAE